MGKSKTKKTEETRSKATGLEAAQPFLQQLLSATSDLSPSLSSAEQQALTGLASSADAGAEFLPDVRGLISDQFAGGGFGEGRDLVTTNFGLLRDALTPTARGDFTDPTQDPILQAALTRAQDDAVNRNRAAFSAGGRSFSPAESRAVSEGVADVTARTLLDERRQQEARQFGALDRLLTGGVTTADFLDATAGRELAARQGAVGLVPQLNEISAAPFRQQLAAEGARFDIPAARIGAIRDVVVPISNTGRTAESTSTTTLEKKDDPLKTAISAGLGVAGILSGAGVFGPAAGAAGGLFGNIGQSTVGAGGLPPISNILTGQRAGGGGFLGGLFR